MAKSSKPAPPLALTDPPQDGPPQNPQAADDPSQVGANPQLTKDVSSADPLADVGDGMPAVQPHAIEAHAAEAAAADPTAPPVVPPSNAAPAGFDPALHETDKKTGKPVLTADGAFRRKRGGAARKLQGVKPGAPAAAAAAAPVTAKVDDARVAMVGESMAQMTIMSGALIFGREAATPIKRTVAPGQELDEYAGLCAGWTTYLASRNITDIPPGVALMFCLGQYYAARVQMESAQPALQRYRKWAYVTFAKVKAWWDGRKRTIPAKGA